MRFLLLQARNQGDEAIDHERRAFREVTRSPEGAIEPWDLLAGVPTRDQVEAVDCVLVGGSGDFGVGDTAGNPWLSAFIDFMGEVADWGKPTFASCFGFQALVVAGGGSVITDKSRAEVGTFDLTVSEAGAADELFGPLAPTFCAQLGHKDHAMVMPSTMASLAYSERCPNQALKVIDKPIYATQFHPELDMVTNRERYLRYLEGYSDPDMADPVDKVLANFRDSSGATALLTRYVRDVLPRYVDARA